MSASGGSKGLASQLLRLALQNKLYWIIPLVLVLLLAVLAILGNQSSGPFVYTLF